MRSKAAADPPERVQTGVRLEKRLVKVLKALAQLYDLSLGELLERSSAPPSPAASRSPIPPLSVVAFTVRASSAEARRWARVAHFLGCRSVSAWLEELAEEQAKRVEELLCQDDGCA